MLGRAGACWRTVAPLLAYAYAYVSMKKTKTCTRTEIITITQTCIHSEPKTETETEAESEKTKEVTMYLSTHPAYLPIVPILPTHPHTPALHRPLAIV